MKNVIQILIMFLVCSSAFGSTIHFNTMSNTFKFTPPPINSSFGINNLWNKEVDDFKGIQHKNENSHHDKLGPFGTIKVVEESWSIFQEIDIVKIILGDHFTSITQIHITSFFEYHFKSLTITPPVTPSSVPLPAAVWLFGSAIAGLSLITRRKNVVKTIF